MTETSKTVATLTAAVLACALALGIGDTVSQYVHSTTDSTTDSTAVYELPSPKTIGKAPHPDRETTASVDCVPLVMADGVDYGHLLSAGWHGDPADGSDVLLYAPGC